MKLVSVINSEVLNFQTSYVEITLICYQGHRTMESYRDKRTRKNNALFLHLTYTLGGLKRLCSRNNRRVSFQRLPSSLALNWRGKATKGLVFFFSTPLWHEDECVIYIFTYSLPSYTRKTI